MARVLGLKHREQSRKRNPVDNAYVIPSILEENTPEERHKASLTIVSNTPRAVAKELLEILGLL